MPPPADAIIPANDGEGEARRRAASAFARLAQSPNPLLLFVTHARGGGVARHVRELASLLAPAANVLVLRPHLRSYLALGGEGEHREARLWFHRDEEWESLLACLRALGVARVHVHHVHGMPPRILELGREIGCPWDVTVHDYYPLCPQYQLVDASGRYCGEPDVAGCTRCLAASPPQWPLGITDWRAAFERLLDGAARVIAPSRDAAARIVRYFPQVSPVVWAHAEPFEPALAARKILVLGGLSPAKGMNVLVACARDALRRGLALRFRVIGHLAWPLDDEGLPIDFTGEYPEGALSSLIERERADAILFPAQWPETWSYTLSAAIDSGLPILATDLGAFPERLADVPGTRLLAWNSPAEQFNDALLVMTEGARPRPPRAATAPDGEKAYRRRYLEGVTPRPGAYQPADSGTVGRALAPEEAIARATLVELFDDGVRSGNGRSTAELQDRLPAADRDLDAATAMHNRAIRAESESADASERAQSLAGDLAATRVEAARLADLERAATARAAEMQSSTSWRLTAPLRALARLLRR
ncbi:MAG: glycosyltransferase [Betaproteobacteria bacterium]|nr:glycosyltransferase [Betaproteobacteria bacterium]